MTYSLPVIERARSEAKNATSSATSSGRLGRPSGIPPKAFINPCITNSLAPACNENSLPSKFVTVVADFCFSHASMIALKPTRPRRANNWFEPDRDGRRDTYQIPGIGPLRGVTPQTKAPTLRTP